MGWLSANVTTSYVGKDEKSSESIYGTRTPNVSDEYRNAFSGYSGALNPNGYNANQQGAVDRTRNYLDRGGAAGRVAGVNTDLTNLRGNFDRFTSGTPNLLNPNAPRATAGVATAGNAIAGTAAAGRATAGTATAGRANAYTIDPVNDVVAQQVRASRGLDYSQGYMDPYLRDVVDTSLSEYDVNAGEARNSLRASSAGAFGNKRTGVAEGQFASDAAIGRGRLASDLRSNAFRFATESGMKDSDRFLTGDMSNQDANLRAGIANAANTLTGRTFNAGAQNDASITNANNDTSTSATNANNATSTSVANANNDTSVSLGNANNLTSTSVANANNLTSTSATNANNNTNISRTNADIQNTRDITDVGSRNTADANAITALGEQVGITNDIAANIFKADGIDIAAAENLFTAGTISQEQLAAIVDAAAAFNGSSFNQNTSGRTNTDTYGVSAEVGFG
jgi:hypothetical protein